MAAPHSNRLLDSLPAAYCASLKARMEEVTLAVPTTIAPPNQIPRYAHFITSGITSVVAFMEDGSGVEVGLLGSESLVEAFYLIGPAEIATTAFVQVSGSALRIPFREIQQEFKANEHFRTRILQSIQGQSLIVSQVAACNRLHEVEERLARWLLMVRDRLSADHFLLTQEFLAEMIGARRTTVTLAAGSLQRSGLIEYSRGHIRILDSDRLQSAACECYPIVRKLVSGLYPAA